MPGLQGMPEQDFPCSSFSWQAWTTVVSGPRTLSKEIDSLIDCWFPESEENKETALLQCRGVKGPGGGRLGQ